MEEIQSEDLKNFLEEKNKIAKYEEYFCLSNDNTVDFLELEGVYGKK